MDKGAFETNNEDMVQTVEQIVRETKEAIAAVMRKHDTPAKKRRLLRELGILEKDRKPRSSTRRVKRSR